MSLRSLLAPVPVIGMAIAISALFGAASADDSKPAECTVVYDQKLIDNVVLPVLKQKEGNVFSIFDLHDPAIFEQQDKNISIVLNQNTGAIDAPLFLITLEPCSLRVLRAGEIDSTTMQMVADKR